MRRITLFTLVKIITILEIVRIIRIITIEEILSLKLERKVTKLVRKIIIIALLRNINMLRLGS